MPDLLLNRSDVFPVGATVTAHPWNAANSEGTAPGAALESQVVAATGIATFTTLSADVPYAFAAVVGGVPRVVRQRLSAHVAPATWKATVAARRAAIGTS